MQTIFDIELTSEDLIIQYITCKLSPQESKQEQINGIVAVFGCD